MNSIFSFTDVIPETFLGVSILFLLIFNLIVRDKDVSKYQSLNNSTFIQVVVVFSIVLVLIFNTNCHAILYSSMFVNTLSSQTLKALIIIFSIIALIPIAHSFNLQRLSFFEYYIFYIISVLAFMLLVSSADFMIVYLIIELQTICFYVLAAFRRNVEYSVEAGLKYFIFGSVVSCIFLFALSLLYWSVGTLNFYQLNLLFCDFPFSNLIKGINNSTILSLILILVALLFKIGVPPFHFWIPDIYEGAPISSTVIFSFLPKMALFFLIINVCKIFCAAFFQINFVFLFFGLISVFLGSLLTLGQDRLKRFIIFSSFSQMGFPVVFLGIGTEEAFTFAYFFIIIYTIVTLIMWIIYIMLYQYAGKGGIIYNEESKKNPFYLVDLVDLFTFDKFLGITVTIVFFSLAGIPPLFGFVMKFLPILMAISNEIILYAIFLLFLTVFSMFYYVKLVKIIFFEKKLYTKKSFSFVYNDDFNFMVLNSILVVFLLLVLVHSFFFFDLWLNFCLYIYINTV